MRTSGDAAEAIEFHWDCDEYCCDVHDVHVSPALSSVTYLGDCGAPTLVLAVPSPHRASHDLAAAHGPIAAGTLSYPRVRATGLQPQASAAHARLPLTRAPLCGVVRPAQAGKHLVFDGRLLHGAVPTQTWLRVRLRVSRNPSPNHSPSPSPNPNPNPNPSPSPNPNPNQVPLALYDALPTGPRIALEPGMDQAHP